MTDVLPLEKDIQNDICEWLEAQGFLFWRSNNIPVFGRNNAGHKVFRSMPKYTPRGIPDIIVIHDGKFIGLEVKRKNKGLSTHQITFRDRVLENGGEYWKVTSVDDVRAIFVKKKLER